MARFISSAMIALIFSIPCIWVEKATACALCRSLFNPEMGEDRADRTIDDLKKKHQENGAAALPILRDALRISLDDSNDPLLSQQIIDYMALINDAESIPIMEDILAELVKRVSFSRFGLETPEFLTRLKAAHALAKFASTKIADRIWNGYDRLNQPKKTEIPYILNALEDPKLTERLMHMLNQEEAARDVMSIAMDVMVLSGDRSALLFLEKKENEWNNHYEEAVTTSRVGASMFYYGLKAKAGEAILRLKK